MEGPRSPAQNTVNEQKGSRRLKQRKPRKEGNIVHPTEEVHPLPVGKRAHVQMGKKIEDLEDTVGEK